MGFAHRIVDGGLLKGERQYRVAAAAGHVVGVRLASSERVANNSELLAVLRKSTGI